MEDDVSRQADELDALRAFYGDDVSAEVKGSEVVWNIRLGRKSVLSLHLPPATYPSSEPPTPRIRAAHVAESRISEIRQELIEMWSADTEVAILWAEHCRSECCCDEEEEEQTTVEKVGQPKETTNEKESTVSYHPPTSRFGQPVRTFDASVVLNDTNQRDIFHGEAFHPPKSGPSERLIAHVAHITSMDHYKWVLAQLLLNDKKVSRASHNMIAYRFFDEERGCMVSDNDDDGERGSGTKLAALLELSGAQDVVVVVSRWFGGVLLGPARFKWIASTARDALEQAGYINNGGKKD
jgi:hypothetical protein